MRDWWLSRQVRSGAIQRPALFWEPFDGGPTSWRADILTSNQASSYREFLLEFSDFQLAYGEQ